MEIGVGPNGQPCAPSSALLPRVPSPTTVTEAHHSSQPIVACPLTTISAAPPPACPPLPLRDSQGVFESVLDEHYEQCAECGRRLTHACTHRRRFESKDAGFCTTTYHVCPDFAAMFIDSKRNYMGVRMADMLRPPNLPPRPMHDMHLDSSCICFSMIQIAPEKASKSRGENRNINSRCDMFQRRRKLKFYNREALLARPVTTHTREKGTL